MRCPGENCNSKLGKIRLDAYLCPVCNKEWLIKRLTRGRRQLNLDRKCGVM